LLLDFELDKQNSLKFQIFKCYRTKEIMEKREKNKGIKIFKEELKKSIYREDGIYKSPKVKVFELPDSKRVFNKDADVI